MNRFLSHALPKGFNRIRHYGLFAKARPVRKTSRTPELLAVPKPQALPDDNGGPNRPSTMRILSVLWLPHDHRRGLCPRCQPHYRPLATTVAIKIDTS